MGWSVKRASHLILSSLDNYQPTHVVARAVLRHTPSTRVILTTPQRLGSPYPCLLLFLLVSSLPSSPHLTTSLPSSLVSSPSVHCPFLVSTALSCTPLTALPFSLLSLRIHFLPFPHTSLPSPSSSLSFPSDSSLALIPLSPLGGRRHGAFRPQPAVFFKYPRAVLRLALVLETTVALGPHCALGLGASTALGAQCRRN